jgi:hypothetical protein
MPPKRKAERKLTGSSSNRGRTNSGGGDGSSNKAGNDLPASAGYLISCDVPTKQYIQHLNDLKTQDKKFILDDLDAEHLLIKLNARAEIDAKVERWMDAVSEDGLLKSNILHITSLRLRQTICRAISCADILLCFLECLLCY